MVGLGYTTPYLGLFRDEAERCLAFMPAAQGVIKWPSARPALAALVEEYDLPLPDLSVDRLILVHALEMSDDAPSLLRELWRVLGPGGRLLLVIPNRRGLWARMDTTPFGQGRPYSRSQILHLLRETSFTPRCFASSPSISCRAIVRSVATSPGEERKMRSNGTSGSVVSFFVAAFGRLLSAAYRGLKLEVVDWDDPDARIPMLANETPQDSVINARPRPAICDIVVILWARMGTPLPETIAKPDGERYQSGTEWEYLDAVNWTWEPKPDVQTRRSV